MSKIVARKYRDEREPVRLVCPEPSLAVQASKDECDINVIIKKYMKTGELPEQRQMIYADISQFTDLRDALHLVNDAEQLFMELPAEIRRRFDNDPVKLVAFAQDPANNAEAIKLGLAKEVQKAPPQPATTTQPPKEGSGQSST